MQKVSLRQKEYTEAMIFFLKHNENKKLLGHQRGSEGFWDQEVSFEAQPA